MSAPSSVFTEFKLIMTSKTSVRLRVSTIISAFSFKAGLALNAIPYPADSIIEISLAPSPTATHSSKEYPASSMNLDKTSTFEPDTNGPVTSPVKTPFSSTSEFVNTLSTFNLSLIVSAIISKLPLIIATSKPFSFKVETVSSAPSIRGISLANVLISSVEAPLRSPTLFLMDVSKSISPCMACSVIFAIWSSIFTNFPISSMPSPSIITLSKSNTTSLIKYITKLY